MAQKSDWCNMLYHIAGKFGEFGESSLIRQSKLVLTIKNLLANLLIRQTFFHQMLDKSQLAKLSHYTVKISILILHDDVVHCTKMETLVSLYGMQWIMNSTPMHICF